MVAHGVSRGKAVVLEQAPQGRLIQACGDGFPSPLPGLVICPTRTHSSRRELPSDTAPQLPISHLQSAKPCLGG